VLPVGGGSTNKRREGIDVPARIDEGWVHRSNEVSACARPVAGGGHATAEHCFIDYKSKGFVLGGEDEQVRGSVVGGELRLVHESQESYSIGTAESRGFRLQWFA